MRVQSPVAVALHTTCGGFAAAVTNGALEHSCHQFVFLQLQIASKRLASDRMSLLELAVALRWIV
jgi:hypothetical protein